ncbi:MAG: sensor histidine kinase [Pseudomonadota bacterium]
MDLQSPVSSKRDRSVAGAAAALPLVAPLRDFLVGRVFWPFAHSMRYFQTRLVAFGLLAVLGFPLYYLVWRYLFPQPYENLELRLIGAALFLPFVFVKWWPERVRPYLPAYWYFALLYALPFFFTFMLLKNDGAAAWFSSALAAMFLLILLLDWLNLIIQVVIGGGLAWLVFALTSDSPLPAALYAEQLPVFLFTLVFGSISNYAAEMVRQEQLRAASATASTLAHELRTPLLGIKTGAAGLSRYLPGLLDAYRLGRSAGLPVANLRGAHLESMEGVLGRIQAEVEYSNAIIDMLLVNVRPNRPGAGDFSSCSMGACIAEALDRYPFASDRERSLVTVGEGDFRFLGDRLLMVHVLFNLLKNALYHIAQAGKGQISIRLEPSAHGGGRLMFRDTGPGIPPNVLPHIFDRFYTWSRSGREGPGMGIGLAFCKSTMQAFGGSIVCHSRQGEFTEFVLTFPPEEK